MVPLAEQRQGGARNVPRYGPAPASGGGGRRHAIGVTLTDSAGSAAIAEPRRAMAPDWRRWMLAPRRSTLQRRGSAAPSHSCLGRTRRCSRQWRRPVFLPRRTPPLAGSRSAGCPGRPDDYAAAASPPPRHRCLFRPAEPLRERPPQRDAEFAQRLEPKPRQRVRRGGHVLVRNHDVNVNDRLGRQARNGGAADVLNRHHRHVSSRHSRGILSPQRLEPLRPGRIVVDDCNHAR